MRARRLLCVLAPPAKWSASVSTASTACSPRAAVLTRRPSRRRTRYTCSAAPRWPKTRAPMGMPTLRTGATAPRRSSQHRLTHVAVIKAARGATRALSSPTASSLAQASRSLRATFSATTRCLEHATPLIPYSNLATTTPSAKRRGLALTTPLEIRTTLKTAQSLVRAPDLAMQIWWGGMLCFITTQCLVSGMTSAKMPSLARAPNWARTQSWHRTPNWLPMRSWATALSLATGP
mmetsp:Transcript_93195/g.150479  ORF Transcript_93195/g.150479 Transcript_93195/m.150479 type:complete len:235 (+) Transcript_93195:1617-2321(+)